MLFSKIFQLGASGCNSGEVVEASPWQAALLPSLGPGRAEVHHTRVFLGIQEALLRSPFMAHFRVVFAHEFT